MKGSNWFVRPVGASFTEAQWKADVALLVETHQTMRAGIAGIKPGEMRRVPPGSKTSNFELITGIAAHDLYHAGQIQLLKRFASPQK